MRMESFAPSKVPTLWRESNLRGEVALHFQPPPTTTYDHKEVNMKTQTIHTNEMTLQPLFGQLANKTHNLTGIASTSTDATTHDHKEVKMKSQTNNKTNSRKPIARSFAVAAVLLSLAGASANAQTGSSGKAQSPIGPTTCTLPIGGGNLCPSSSYRIGAVGTVYNSNLTGSPLGDGHVLNST